MTSRQLQKFKEKAKISNMTVQDYINWLSLFIDEPDTLLPRHLANLHKIQRGLPLTLNDLPRAEPIQPLSAQQYFDNLSTVDDQMIPQNLDTAGLQLPANYRDYSQFETPKNLKHLDDYNHEEKLKKYQHRRAIKMTQPQISYDWNN